MSKFSVWLITTLLLVYFLFTSGLLYWVSGSAESSRLIIPFSWSLSAEEQGFTPIAAKGDIDCIRWIINNRNTDLIYFCDTNGIFLLNGWVGDSTKIDSVFYSYSVPRGYIFSTDWNTKSGEYAFCSDVGMRSKISYYIKPLVNEGLLLCINSSTFQGIIIPARASLVKEVYRSGDSIIYEKLGDMETE